MEGVRKPSAPDDSPSQRNGARRLSAILCADWGKESPKRAVYVADVIPLVRRRDPPTGGPWPESSLKRSDGHRPGRSLRLSTLRSVFQRAT